MSPLMIAQMFAILAPIAREAFVEGNKIVVTYKENISQEDLNKTLELSKSAGWPELTFKP